MKPNKILIVITVICGVLSGYGVAVSTGPDSLGSYLRAIFGSIGVMTISALFVTWYFSGDRDK